jgi:hypothetical protein
VLWGLIKFTSADGSQDAKSERALVLLRSVELPLSTHIENLIGKSNEFRAAFDILFFSERFSAIFNSQAIEAVWDKIISMDSDFEVLLVVALLRVMKDSLISIPTFDGLIKHLRSCNYDQRQAHAILSRAMDLKPALEKLDKD